MKQVFMVSLGRCPDRRESMVTQFSNHGIPYEIVEAVDGQEKDQTDGFSADPEAFRKIYKKPPKRGEFGCYISHLKALEYVVTSGEPYGCIMEDDLRISKSWDEILKITERQLTEVPMFDMFYPGKPIMDRTERIHDRPGGIKESIRLKVPPVGTQCYFVSAKLAEYILENFRTFYRPIDQTFRMIPRMNDGLFSFYKAKPEDYWVRHDFKFKSEVTK